MICHKRTKVLQIFLQVWSSCVATNFSPNEVSVDENRTGTLVEVCHYEEPKGTSIKGYSRIGGHFD